MSSFSNQSLISEFNLTSGELGLLGGAYFLGFASVQIPLGYLLDSNPSSDSVAEAVNYVNSERALKMRSYCEEFAGEFTDVRFNDKVCQHINNAF